MITAKRLIAYLSGSILLGCTQLALAVEKVELFAIFGDKAVLMIDGQRRMLANGEQSPEGVTLLETSGDAVRIRIGEREQRVEMGNRIALSTQPAQSPTTTIWPDEHGMYRASASLNGHTLDVLVDTGATSVALSERHARAIGLDYRNSSRQGVVETASGKARAYAVELNRVKLGGIELYNVPAVVLQGDYPTEVLLGMTFLSRVRMDHQGRALKLEKPW